LRQQLRALESHVRDKDQKLLTIYLRSIERDQEATTAKARELTNFQAAKAQEINDLQDELQENEEELQEHEIELANRDNEIASHQA
jgi:hypothetical protein